MIGSVIEFSVVAFGRACSGWDGNCGWGSLSGVKLPNCSGWEKGGGVKDEAGVLPSTTGVRTWDGRGGGVEKGGPWVGGACSEVMVVAVLGWRLMETARPASSWEILLTSLWREESVSCVSCELAWCRSIRRVRSMTARGKLSRTRSSSGARSSAAGGFSTPSSAAAARSREVDRRVSVILGGDG